MGTVRHATGAIYFSPSLTAVELRDPAIRPYTESTTHDIAVQLVVAEERVETDDGTLIRRYANTITPTWEHDDASIAYYGNRHIPDCLIDLVKLLDARDYTGTIEVCADISHTGDFDAYRLTVETVDGVGPVTIHQSNATVTWEPPATLWREGPVLDVVR